MILADLAGPDPVMSLFKSQAAGSEVGSRAGRGMAEAGRSSELHPGGL